MISMQDYHLIDRQTCSVGGHGLVAMRLNPGFSPQNDADDQRSDCAISRNLGIFDIFGLGWSRIMGLRNALLTFSLCRITFVTAICVYCPSDYGHRLPCPNAEDESIYGD